MLEDKDDIVRSVFIPLVQDLGRRIPINLDMKERKSKNEMCDCKLW